MSLVNIRVKLLLFLVALVCLAAPAAGNETVVRMQTSLGVVDVELYDSQAPLTVANFLNYVNRGAFNNSFIHRSMPNFVVQGGGYALNNDGTKIFAIPKDAPVINEFSYDRSNLRGTITMAKVADNPDSATSQWFINLADNSANLDNQNGGFTVFGKVMGNGMAVFDAIDNLRKVNAGGVFANLPVIDVPQDNTLGPENLVMIRSVAVLPTSTAATPSDRLFNYLEAVFPEFIAPASQPSAPAYGYYYRYYSGTNAYLGTMNDMVYYAGPASNWAVLPLGSLAEWLTTAVSAGY